MKRPHNNATVLTNGLQMLVHSLSMTQCPSDWADTFQGCMWLCVVLRDFYQRCVHFGSMARVQSLRTTWL